MGYTFSLGLRGYDRDAVDQLVAGAEAAITSGTGEERASAAADIARGVPIVLRGYDRSQVDNAFRRLTAKLAK
jgi:hypothetical protein